MNLDQVLRDTRPGAMVHAEWDLGILGIGPLPLCFTGVDTEGFSPMAFQAQGIDCPPRIGASVAKRQAEFLAGRLCARVLLQKAEAAETQVAVGALSAPQWPQGWTGSITHTRAFAAAALLRSGACAGIGIDLEQVADEAACAALGTIALNPREDCLFARTPGLGLAAFRTAVFSAKESFFKATAGMVGRYFDFSAIELVDLDFARGLLYFVVREPLHALLPPGAPVTAAILHHGDYILTASVGCTGAANG
jgi:enterobactin synthetase component D